VIKLKNIGKLIDINQNFAKENKMKTKLFIITIILILILLLTSFITFATEESFEGFPVVNLLLKTSNRTIVVNGDVPPIIINGRTMVPVRFIAEKLGFAVGWDETTRTVMLGKNENDLKIDEDSGEISDKFEEFPTAKLSFKGKAIIGDTPAIILNGRTLIPVRFITEALGYEVTWDQETRSAIIIIENADIWRFLNNKK
jgi:N-acetylmuramoyl-L-alanine amidase